MSRPEKSSDSAARSDRSRGPGPAGTPPDEEFYQHVRTVVDEASTPITVSTLAERLDDTDDESAYGDVHEALYRDCLQTLDAEGALVFDMEVGLVYAADSGDVASDGFSV
ncbi:hypothetical protein [Halorussus sp. AFM4]|uniref:hypothetical protein n=1 Tax=Halorussus sp. AFM4 TaxID=3421651 RepID=UPI003EBACB59